MALAPETWGRIPIFLYMCGRTVFLAGLRNFTGRPVPSRSAELKTGFVEGTRDLARAVIPERSYPGATRFSPKYTGAPPMRDLGEVRLGRNS